MKLKSLAPLLTLAFAVPASAASSAPQRLWTLPAGAIFEGLRERPNARLNIYWSGRYVRFSTLDTKGKLLQSGEVPGHQMGGNGIAREDWNARGQHAFLPQCDGSTTNFLRLKNGNSYRVLRILPRFDRETLQDLKFSPDGECLYVLGTAKLWIIGAQSGRLVKIVKPRWGRKWSDENAALSPDCRKILAMRGKMAFFSTRSGKLLQRFGNKIETFTGHCGDLQARVFFSQNGRFAVASMQDINDYETWVYPAYGGALRWHGRTPYDILETARGHFFLDTPRLNDQSAVSTVLRRWRDGKTGWHLKLNFDNSDRETPTALVFSRDGRWIYFARHKSVWRLPMPNLSQVKAAKL
jgi:hypothetical protein